MDSNAGGRAGRTTGGACVGGWFQLEFPIKDEAKWWGKKTTGQQHDELYYIRDHLLKGAILGATKGRAEAAWNSST